MNLEGYFRRFGRYRVDPAVWESCFEPGLYYGYDHGAASRGLIECVSCSDAAVFIEASEPAWSVVFVCIRHASRAMSAFRGPAFEMNLEGWPLPEGLRR